MRAALLSATGGVERARRQDDGQLHLTLRFVGEVDRHVAADLVAALDEVTGPGFDLRVHGVGHFEKKGKPTALWAAFAPCPALETLERRIERAARAAGLHPETRNFVPHVTLARLGGQSVGAGAWLGQHGDLTAPRWQVDAFRLYESRMGRGGSAYTSIAQWPLEPPDGRPGSTSDSQ